MNEYEVIRRRLRINNLTYLRGDKISLPEDVYMSYQKSLRLLEKISKSKKPKKVKLDEIKD